MGAKCHLGNIVREGKAEGEVVRLFDPQFQAGHHKERWFVTIGNEGLDREKQEIVCFGHGQPAQMNLRLTEQQQERFGISQKVVQVSFYAELEPFEDIFMINGTNHQLFAHEIPDGTAMELLPQDYPAMSTIVTDELIKDDIPVMDFVGGFATEQR